MKQKVNKILLVEDDIFLLSMYSAKFVAEGFTVHGAMNAKEALELAVDFAPDIILLHVMLPGENGISVLQKLKRGKATATIPVVVLSNLTEAMYREEALIYGALDYWIKAYYDPEEIVAKTRNILS